jgi:hypothetical protein
MLVLEKDVYPAFTSGETDRIVKALESVISSVKESNTEADAVFRAMNWSWPMLTSRAKSHTPDGVVIIGKFVELVTALLENCSSSLISAIASCKSILRAIFRGVSCVKPGRLIPFLSAIETYVFPEKAARGFFLDKAAVDQLIALSDSTEYEEVGECVDKFLFRILKTRRLFSNEVLVDFMVKLIKANQCSSHIAFEASRILEAHDSKQLYDMLMDRLSFVQIQSETSILRKLTLINFYIEIIKTPCQGEMIPASISKSELTTSIMNYSSNRLIALFTTRLISTILSRLPKDFEGTGGSLYVRDKLVEINSLVPVLKALIEGEFSSGNTLLLQEIFSSLKQYKRAFPGSFIECKFDWSKLLTPNQPLYSKIVSRFLSSIVCDALPVTQQVAKTYTLLACMEEGTEPFKKWLVSGSGSHLVSNVSEIQAVVYAIRKSGNESRFVENFFSVILQKSSEVIEQSKTSTSVLSTILRMTGDADLVEVFEKKLSKLERKRTLLEEPLVTEGMAASVTKKIKTTGKISLPRISLKNRWKCPPIPEDSALELYDLTIGNWSTILFANEMSNVDEPSINLIDLVGSNKLYFAILSLASDNECVRVSAFEVLSVVLRALAVAIESKGVESNRFAFREAPQVAMILTWLRNGIKAPEGEKQIPDPLPLINCVFVVEAIRLMFDPKHELYPAVFKFVLSRPGMNTESDIQMWASTFFSTDGENFKIARNWILEVARIGAKDPRSIELMVRRGVVEAILEASVQLNGSQDEFWSGLEIVSRILESLEEKERIDFIRKFNLSQWICFVSQSRFLKFDS